MFLSQSGVLIIGLAEAVNIAGLILVIGHLLGMATYCYFEKRYGKHGRIREATSKPVDSG